MWNFIKLVLASLAVQAVLISIVLVTMVSASELKLIQQRELKGPTGGLVLIVYEYCVDGHKIVTTEGKSGLSTIQPHEHGVHEYRDSKRDSLDRPPQPIKCPSK